MCKNDPDTIKSNELELKQLSKNVLNEVEFIKQYHTVLFVSEKDALIRHDLVFNTFNSIAKSIYDYLCKNDVRKNGNLDKSIFFVPDEKINEVKNNYKSVLYQCKNIIMNMNNLTESCLYTYIVEYLKEHNIEYVHTRDIYNIMMKTPGYVLPINKNVLKDSICHDINTGEFGLGELKNNKEPCCTYFQKSLSNVVVQYDQITFNDNEIIIKKEYCENNNNQ